MSINKGQLAIREEMKALKQKMEDLKAKIPCKFICLASNPSRQAIKQYGVSRVCPSQYG